MVKQTNPKTTKRQAKKVDFEPNKMGIAIAAMASVTLVLLAVIATQN